MRNIILFIACGIIVTTLFLTISCSTTTPKSQEITYLADITEDDFIHATVDELQKISLIPSPSSRTDEGAQESIRIAPISELSIRTGKHVSIQGVDNKWLSNEIERKRNVQHYWASVSGAIDELKTMRMERNGSAVFESP